MKTAAISVRVTDTVKAAMEKAAQDDRRSTASMVEKIISAWLQQNGYLPVDPDGRK